MKKIVRKMVYTISYFCIGTLLFSCTPSASSLKDFAQEKFEEQCQYMSEREAISHSVNYYESPQITQDTYIEMTGRQIIAECRQLEEREAKQEMIQMGPTSFKITHPVGDIIEYATDHPDDIVAYKYNFHGYFTHWNNGRDIRKAYVYVIPGMKSDNDKYRFFVIQYF